MEANIVSGLSIATFIILVAVTGGIAYLTVSEWRDRRRREQDTKSPRR
jgi:uncharacterized iron-regulated membrane protein